MSRNAREQDLRVSGLGLAPRFVLSMSAALALVMAVAAVVLYSGTTRIAEQLVNDTVSEAVVLTHQSPMYEPGSIARRHKRTGVQRTTITYGEGNRRQGMIYYLPNPQDEKQRPLFEIMVPGGQKLGRKMLGIIGGIMALVLIVGAVVALWVANQVTRPIQRIIEDIRQIAHGNLAHRTWVVGAGEIQLLARSIDRMTRDLESALDTELELSIREREMDLAAGVREALLPLATPLLEGYDLGAVHLGSPDIGGDFHDFIELSDGRVGLLVCDVSGQGVPAALVGATARSYLRSELSRGGDPREAFCAVNAWLGGDVRRGMYVTALYVLIEPTAGVATVLCAGHKVPLVRYSAEDGKLRLVHPDGIAFGFDRGPVFERRLEVQAVPLMPGDRIFLSNSAPVRMTNPAGRELGEKAFFSRVLKHSSLDTVGFLKALRNDIRQFCGRDEVPFDVSLVTIDRTAQS